MAEYKNRVTSPNAELLGGMIYSLWGAFPEGYQAIVHEVLANHGIKDVVPENWYRLQPVLDALKEIEERFGHYLLREVGEQAAVHAPIPPEIDSLHACLFALNPTLNRFHRGGDIGGNDVKEEKTESGLKRYRVTDSTPYPCMLTGGYLQGLARRFGSRDYKEVLVRHDDESPCRRQGAEFCTYFVTCW
ncbi:MAG: hypothetical protein WBG50_21960 [Desulfomonilaceae bacterium]